MAADFIIAFLYKSARKGVLHRLYCTDKVIDIFTDITVDSVFDYITIADHVRNNARLFHIHCFQKTDRKPFPERSKKKDIRLK